ncbi:MAG: GTPase HflX [Planctomycetota bacterium]
MAGRRAVLACLLPARPARSAAEEEPLEELRRLTESAGAEVVGRLSQRREHPTGSHYLGRGKVTELKRLVRSARAEAVVFDDDLTPVQGRNLEKDLGCQVMDRTELILDIFATHARTRQAKLQVELAALEYFLPRLRRRWTHLERQVGGIGVRAGAGERQIEVDRRLVGRRIADVRDELGHIRRRRERLVAARTDFSVSLVGYTNAGKSTLMRALTGADVLIEDRLFATLDTRTREMRLGGGLSAMLSDTIGFVRRLPHHLVASFSATLEETRSADLVLHVVDLSSAAWRQEMETVRAVLGDIGASEQPVLVVFNKVDLVHEPADLTRARADLPGSAAVSALKGTGIDDLREIIAGRMLAGAEDIDLFLPAADGRASAFLRRHGRIHETLEQDGGLRVRASVLPACIGRLEKMPGVRLLARGDLET